MEFVVLVSQLEIRPPLPEESSRLVSLMTAGESPMRCQLLSSQISAALTNDLAQATAFVAVVAGQLHAAAVAIGGSGGSGVLCGLKADERAEPKIVVSLFEEVAKLLRTWQVRFIQAATEVGCEAVELKACGFSRLAVIEYLSAEIASLPNAVSAELRFTNSDVLEGDEFVNLVQETYVDSQDCPAIEAMRSARDTLLAYKAAPSFTPELWRVAWDDTKPVGCILCLPFEDSGILEITYMALHPGVRRRGWGKTLIAEASRVASERKLQTLTLGVDQQNLPAGRLYRGIGFEKVYEEAIWGRNI